MVAKQRITARNPVWTHRSKLFRIDELTVESEGAPPIQWATFERGDAVAALIVNTDTAQAMLVKQFRPPVAAYEGADHQLVELAAGMIPRAEQPMTTLQREIREETGYILDIDAGTGNLKGVEAIGQYYASPGGSSERIYLYYVAVNSRTAKEGGGGDRKVGEFIETEWIALEDLWRNIDEGVYRDAKIIIAGLWLEKRWINKRSHATRAKEEFAYQTRALVNHRWQDVSKVVGYYASDIRDIKDVDVWVSSSNAEFLMDTVYHGTVSARIRALGGRRSGDILVEDTIQAELTRKLGIGRGMDVGNVLETGPGSLRDSHNVRCLLHVASIKARVKVNGDVETVADLEGLQGCVIRALERCDELNRWGIVRRVLQRPYRSVLLPLFGAGVDRESGGLDTKRICERLIPAAVEYIKRKPESKLERIYFLAYTPTEREYCDSVLSRQAGLVRC